MSQKIKIMLLGESKVGKTKLALKLLDQPAMYRYLPTIGVDRYFYHTENERLISLYDSGGSERYQPIVQQYYKTPDIFVLTFAFEKQSSVHYLAHEIEQIKQVNPKATFLLLGLKTPEIPLTIHSISQTQIESFLTEHKIDNYFQCDCENTKYLHFLNEKFIQAFEKRQNLLSTIRNQQTFDPFWKKSYPLLKKIECVLLDYQLKGNMNNFFEFRRYENKRAVIQIIKRHTQNLHSWEAAFNILRDLKLFNEKHQNSMLPAIDYLEDKLTIEFKNEPHSYTHSEQEHQKTPVLLP